jgi:predicted transposase/invertase (TIGR01784 family)
MGSLNNIHDKYFKSAMSCHQVAREFFESYLPAEVLKQVDLSRLNQKKESYIDTHLKNLMSDILYQVDFDGKPGFLYILVEHQSTPQRLMPFRVLRYMCRIMGDHIDKRGGKYLPVVVPIVFYHGRVTYPYSRDIFDCFGDEADLARSFLLSPFQLVDLSTIPDTELEQKRWSGVFQFIQKHIYDDSFQSSLETLTRILKNLESVDGDWYIISNLKYILEAASLTDIEAFKSRVVKRLPPKIGDEIMTLADTLIAKGKALGEATGVERGQANAMSLVAKNMLEEGYTDQEIAKLTGLSIETIQALVESTQCV